MHVKQKVRIDSCVISHSMVQIGLRAGVRGSPSRSTRPRPYQPPLLGPLLRNSPRHLKLLWVIAASSASVTSALTQKRMFARSEPRDGPLGRIIELDYVVLPCEA